LDGDTQKKALRDGMELVSTQHVNFVGKDC
jgi:hypothetical protein